MVDYFSLISSGPRSGRRVHLVLYQTLKIHVPTQHLVLELVLNLVDHVTKPTRARLFCCLFYQFHFISFTVLFVDTR